MDRHPVFFVTDWYIFEVFLGVEYAKYVFSSAVFVPVMSLFVNTSVRVLYLL